MANYNEDYDLGKILEKTRNLLANQGVSTNVRSLSQLNAITKKMSQQYDVNNDMTAHIFFAQKGLELSKHQSAIDSLSSINQKDNIDPIHDADIDYFINHQQSLLVSSVIEECHDFNETAFQELFQRRLEQEWNQSKRDIIESMNFQMTLPKSDKTVCVSMDSIVDLKPELSLEQEAYFRAVEKINTDRLSLSSSERIPATKYLRIASREIETSRATDDDYEIAECWDLLHLMISEYEQCGLSATDSDLKSAMCRGVCMYLEDLFRSHMIDTIYEEHTIPSNEILEIQNNPTTENMVMLVNAYCQSRVFKQRFNQNIDARVTSVNSIWAKAFLAIRMGEHKTAIHILENAVNTSITCPMLISALRAYNYGLLNSSVWNNLYNEYSTVSGAANPDPFCLFIYRILGKFNLDSGMTKSEVGLIQVAIEDYLWCKQIITVINKNELPSWLVSNQMIVEQTTTLKSFQNHINKMKSDKFTNNGTNPYLYIKILLATQQFELLISYLISLKSHTGYILAVHFIIALNCYDLINIVDPTLTTMSNNDAILAYTTKNGKEDVPSINAIPIFLSYQKAFALAHPVIAFHYLYVMRQFPITDNNHLVHNPVLQKTSTSTDLIESSTATLGELKNTIVAIDSLTSDSVSSGKYHAISNLGVESSYIIDLIVNTQAFNVLIGVSRNIWASKDEYIKLGELCKFYDNATVTDVCLKVGTKLLDKGLIEPALSILALQHNYATCGIVLMIFANNSILEKNQTNTQRALQLLTSYLAVFNAQTKTNDNVSNLALFNNISDRRLMKLDYLIPALQVLVDTITVINYSIQCKQADNVHLLDKVLDLVSQMHLFPNTTDNTEWVNIQNRVKALPSLVTSVYSTLILTYHELINMQQVELTKHVTMCQDDPVYKTRLNNIQERGTILTQFVLNRFDFVTKDVYSVLLKKN